MQDHIRNFSIIAHIDHGKSTLADMLIRRCGALSEREMKAQVLDSMDLERERGITIKSQTATLNYQTADGQKWNLNLIDTPGHVDFSYEVSRSLAACEGALLVVDAVQSVQAQTIANTLIAVEQDVAILPVINKIDLAAADPQRVCAEIEDMIGIDSSDAISVSAKTGEGIDEILNAIVRRFPPPQGAPEAPLRALIIDSWFDKYLGIVILTRIIDGQLHRNDKICFYSNKEVRSCESLGIFTPKMEQRQTLACGEVGFVVTGLKDIRIARVGDTITHEKQACETPLVGFHNANSHVFASFYPSNPNDFPALREAAEKLQLNDAALKFETENSPALGYGLRCGFLGMLHMEITQERLEREYDLDLIIASPGVIYEVLTTNGELLSIDHPSRLPPANNIKEVREPMTTTTIVAPQEHVGATMTLAMEHRGTQKRLEHAGKQVVMEFDIPLAELISGFFDQLKSATHGYASINYEFKHFQPAAIVCMDILINGDRIEALSSMVPREFSQQKGRALAAKMRELIPRQMFDVAIQAAIGSKVIARETVKALRKNVTAKCYGGDVSRKRKLLEKQKEGKKRMRRFGKVEIPQAAFMAVLKQTD